MFGAGNAVVVAVAVSSRTPRFDKDLPVPRYVAFLRGVSPMNAKMPELKLAFEMAGFTAVKTVLASGNVVFQTRSTSIPATERKAEAAMKSTLTRSFLTIVRSTDELQEMLGSDPYGPFALPEGAKRIVTFFREATQCGVPLPLALKDASVFSASKHHAFAAYVSTPTAPASLALIEKTFGKNVTTRTWDTVRKCVAASIAT